MIDVREEGNMKAVGKKESFPAIRRVDRIWGCVPAVCATVAS